MSKPVANVAQQAELAKIWASNPYSVRELFDGVRAVPLSEVLTHLRARGLPGEQAIGWLATMTQVGRLRMISLDLVQLGPRAEPVAAPAQ